jgi:hypothetical protein
MTRPANTRIFRVSLTRWESFALFLEARSGDEARVFADTILMAEGTDAFISEDDGLTTLTVEEMTGEGVE